VIGLNEEKKTRKEKDMKDKYEIEGKNKRNNFLKKKVFLYIKKFYGYIYLFF